jgi:hypothetical protein
VTIQELGSLGELIAAIATVATLIYLALQIRQNTRSTQAASFHAIYDSMNHVNMSVIQNSELTRLWLAGAADRGSLSPEELHKFDFTLLSYFHVFETMHYQASLGAGTQDLVLAEERSLRNVLTMPGAREWWAANPYAFRPEFRSYVEALLDQTEGDSTAT